MAFRTVKACRYAFVRRNQNNTKIFITDCPAVICREAASCIPGLEICRIVDSCIKANRCQRIGFAKSFGKQLSFTIIFSEGKRRYDTDCLRMVIFSAFCAIHFRRVFTQVANHLVYDCLCFFGICFDNQVQLICGCVFQVFFLSFQFLYVFFDLVIFCVFDPCHEFFLLISIHAVISGKQGLNNAFLALRDKRFIIRQLI